MEGEYFMERQAKVPFEEKLRAIEDHLSGKRGTSQICYELQIHKRTFYDWLRKYQIQGKQGLQTLSAKTYYPLEMKQQAIKDYQDGLGSLDQICSKYNISAHSILQRWIKKYNGHEIHRYDNAQGDRFMTKGRKTTYEERLEILAFCVENNTNYQMTSNRFQVSYQQVYTWMKKYKDHGYEALLDRRGKPKNPEEMSEAEKSDVQFRHLEAEIKRLKMENDFLKKLSEVERRR